MPPAARALARRPLRDHAALEVRALHGAGPAEVEVETPAPRVSAVHGNVDPVARAAPDAEAQPARRGPSRRRLEIKRLLHLPRIERLTVLIDVRNDPLVEEVRVRELSSARFPISTYPTVIGSPGRASGRTSRSIAFRLVAARPRLPPSGEAQR